MHAKTTIATNVVNANPPIANMKKLLYIALCLPLLLASCSHDIVSSDYCDLQEEGWAMTDTTQLSIRVPDTMQAYDLTLILRHTDTYNYQNLWLFVSSPDSLCPILCDTVQACLADDRGRWLGTRAGRYYSGFVTMEKGITFPQAGTYTFRIVHGMRDSVIQGIADIGMELRKHDYGKE